MLRGDGSMMGFDCDSFALALSFGIYGLVVWVGLKGRRLVFYSGSSSCLVDFLVVFDGLRVAHVMS